MRRPRPLLALLLVALALAGCLRPAADEPDRIRFTHLGSATGDATLRFRAEDGTVAATLVVPLQAGWVGEYRANLTSEVRYVAEVDAGGRTLVSEPFFTGLGGWVVEILVDDDAVRVTTIHAD